MSILDEIVDYKRQVEIPRRMQKLPQVDLRSMAEDLPGRLDFASALIAKKGVALIAEVKKASPSGGLLCPDLDVLKLAQTYAENGAAAISVLTDEKYFQGSLDNLNLIRRSLKEMPLLCKEFIISPYQLYEAYLNGADCVLLIAAVLDEQELTDLYDLSRELGMQALIETHDAAELERVMRVNPDLIGVNNRNLHDFSIDINTCLNLRKLVPPEICFVAESGIHTAQDIQQLCDAGVDAALVGEALVCAADTGAKLRELANGN